MKLKGIVQPSHQNQAASSRRGSPFRPGRRYPISITAALALEEKLQAYFKKGEGIDLARMTRFESPGNWTVWTTLGRKVEVVSSGPGQIEEAQISDEADPEIPARVR